MVGAKGASLPCPCHSITEGMRPALPLLCFPGQLTFSRNNGLSSTVLLRKGTGSTVSRAAVGEKFYLVMQSVRDGTNFAALSSLTLVVTEATDSNKDWSLLEGHIHRHGPWYQPSPEHHHGPSFRDLCVSLYFLFRLWKPQVSRRSWLGMDFCIIKLLNYYLSLGFYLCKWTSWPL